jgi:hypothetical protein
MPLLRCMLCTQPHLAADQSASMQRSSRLQTPARLASAVGLWWWVLAHLQLLLMHSSCRCALQTPAAAGPSILEVSVRPKQCNSTLADSRLPGWLASRAARGVAGLQELLPRLR